MTPDENNTYWSQAYRANPDWVDSPTVQMPAVMAENPYAKEYRPVPVRTSLAVRALFLGATLLVVDLGQLFGPVFGFGQGDVNVPMTMFLLLGFATCMVVAAIDFQDRRPAEFRTGLVVFSAVMATRSVYRRLQRDFGNPRRH